MEEQQSAASPRERKSRVRAQGKRQRLTQQAIVAGAAELFAERGFGATSLDEIADSLGVGKASLYYHVKNKEEILRLIFLTVLTASEDPLRRIAEANFPPRDKLYRAIVHQTSVAADRSPSMIVFYREQFHLTGPFAKEIILRKKQYERYFEQIIQQGQAAGVFQPEADPKIITFALLGMCNWLSQWYRPGGQYSSQRIAELFVNLIEQGLLLSSIPSPFS
jgi:AcrR family transcriptional regulator